MSVKPDYAVHRGVRIQCGRKFLSRRGATCTIRWVDGRAQAAGVSFAGERRTYTIDFDGLLDRVRAWID